MKQLIRANAILLDTVARFKLSKLSAYNYRLLLLILSLSGAAIRLWGASIRPPHEDEVALWMEALGWEAYTADSFLPTYATFAVMWLTNDFSWRMARLVPAILGAFAAVGTGLLGEYLSNRRVGFMAACIVTVAPILVFFSRQARPYGYWYFFTPFLFLFFLRAMTEGKRRNWTSFSVFTALTTLSHYNAFLMVGAIGLVGGVTCLWKRKWNTFLSLVFATVIGSAPSLIYYKLDVRGEVFDTRTFASLSSYLLTAMNTLSPIFFHSFQPVTWESYLTFVLVLMGYFILASRNRLACFSMLLSTIGMLTVVGYFLGDKATYGIFYCRYFSALMILIPILIALATEKISLVTRLPFVLLALPPLFLFAKNLPPRISYTSDSNSHHLSAFIKDLRTLKEIDGIVVGSERDLGRVQNEYGPRLRYYLARSLQFKVFPTYPVSSRGKIRTLMKVSYGVISLPPGRYAYQRCGATQSHLGACLAYSPALAICTIPATSQAHATN